MWKQWQYRMLRFDLSEDTCAVEDIDDQVVEEFNVMGLEGWELAPPFGLNGRQIVALFKRQISG